MKRRVGHAFSSSLLVPSPSLPPLGRRRWPVIPVPAVGLPGSCLPSPPLSWSSLSLLSSLFSLFSPSGPLSLWISCPSSLPPPFAIRVWAWFLLSLSSPFPRCLVVVPVVLFLIFRIPLVFVVLVLVFLALVVPWRFRRSHRDPVFPFFMAVVPVVLMVPSLLLLQPPSAVWLASSSRRCVVGVSFFERRG